MRRHIIRRESYWELGEFMKMKMFFAVSMALSLNGAIQAEDSLGCNKPEYIEHFKQAGADDQRYKECKVIFEQLKKDYSECQQIPDKVCSTLRTALGSFLPFQNATEAISVQAARGRIDCEDKKKKLISQAESMKAVGHNEDSDGLVGTSALRKCVELSGYNMRYLYGKSKKHDFKWDDFINATDECIKEQCSPEDTEAKKKCQEVKLTAARCDGAAFIINEFGRSWLSPEHVRPTDVKGGNPEIKCTAVGLATIDFEGCAKFVENGQALELAQNLIQTGQDLYFQDKTTTAQLEASKSTNTATASLEAMKTSVKGQADIMNQRAALDTSKFAFLANYYAEIPSDDDLAAVCKKYSNTVGGHSNGCNLAVTRQDQFAFLLNQQSKEKMKAKLAQVGINVATDLVKASLLSKRAGEIDNAIANVNSFSVIDPAGIKVTDAQSTYCQLNPGDAKCFTGGLNRTVDVLGDNVITFGEGGTGTVYHNTNPTLGDSTGAAGSDTGTSKDKSPVTSVGSVISSAQQNGGVADIAGAATVSKGSDPAGGGGGGGSGGGGVGGGGGGGAAPAGGQPAAGSLGGFGGKGARYDGGGGTLSMMGGFGINKSKSTGKEDGNPFAKLLGKDGNRSGAIDFGRNPASQRVGNKTDNIFEMISKRYTNVNDSKRLIEYEIAK